MAMEKTGDIAHGKTPPEHDQAGQKQAGSEPLRKLEQDPAKRMAEQAAQDAKRDSAN